MSRVRILEELKRGPLDVPTLSERVGLHPNTVRSHLEILGEAGLVAGGPEKRDRPGRPRVIYRALADPDAPGEGGYRLLAKILASYLAGASADPTAAAEEAGEAWGRYLAEKPPPFAKLSSGEATAKVVQLLADLGFAPESESEALGQGRILLHRCPFREAVETNKDVVCSVHLGLMRGALREMGAPLEAARLEPLVTPSLCVAHLTAAAGRPRRDG